MRFYAKLAGFVALFVFLTRAGGESARQCAWDVSFAARCQAVHVLGNQRLEERLVAEAGVELQRRLERDLTELAAARPPGGRGLRQTHWLTPILPLPMTPRPPISPRPRPTPNSPPRPRGATAHPETSDLRRT